MSYQPHGAVRDLWYAEEPEVCIEGPAGTGKTRGVLELFNAKAWKYPHSKQLITRKVGVALVSAALETFRNKVIPRELESGVISFYGGSKAEPAAFKYTNGSRIMIGGLDDAEKTFSTEYDNAYVNEMAEITLDDLELLKRSLRNFVMPRQQLYGDTNPSHDKHWLMKRWRDGQMRRIRSTIKDNPAYWDAAKAAFTEQGRIYIETNLEGLTGSRRQRLLLGEWVGMENAIYETLDRDLHLLAIPEDMTWGKAAVGVDYGTVHISAVVVVQKDSSGRIWARECWTGGEEEDPIVDIARSYKRRYNASVGVVDPIPAMQMLADKLGFIRSGESTKGSRGSEGSRIANIMRVKTLLGTDALRFDLNGLGIADLFAEAQMYRWLHKDTENIEKYVVDRHNDDRVAAMEYAIEALETTQPSATGVATVAVPVATTTQRQHVGGIGKARQSQAPRRIGGLNRA